MSFKRKLISTVSLALAVGTFSTFVAAQDSTTTNQTEPTKRERKFDGQGGREIRGGKHGGGDRMMMGALRRLNLTDAQKAQVRTILESNKPNQGQFEEMRGLMQKKRDGSIIDQEQTRLREIRTQSKANAEQTHNSILAILTDDQKAQLEQLKQQKHERRGDRKGMRNGGQTPTTPTDN